MLFSPCILSFIWESMQNGGQQQIFQPTQIAQNYSTEEKFSNLSKLFEHRNFSRVPNMFWHKWKISSTFIRCQKISGREKFPEMPKIFEHRDLSRVLCPKLWAQIKILNPYNLPRQLTNSKNAQIFWSVLEKKFSWIFLSTKIFWLPILFSRNEKSSTYTICAKYEAT